VLVFRADIVLRRVFGDAFRWLPGRHQDSAVINVGTATIAAFIGAGGYGERWLLPASLQLKFKAR